MSQNNQRSILPGMIEISNNSRITQETANTLAEKLTPKEFEDFRRWLQIANTEHMILKRRKLY